MRGAVAVIRMQLRMGAGINSATKHGTISDDRFPRACRVLEEGIAGGAFPGCAFGVLAGGKAVLQDARGRLTYEQRSPAVTATTVFDLASVSKVVATTAIAMLLYQRRQINIDALLGDLLPEFLTGRASEDPARGIRLRHLLAHNSGLPAYVEFFKQAKTPEELLQACLRLNLETPPGVRSHYSDPGFILLGKALERCTGEALDALAQREIFASLALASTCFCPSPDFEQRFRRPRTIRPSDADAFRERFRMKTHGFWVA